MPKTKMMSKKKTNKREKTERKSDSKDRFVSAPASKSRIMQNRSPVVRQNKPGTLTISHREYVKALTGSVTDYTVVFNQTLNPGLRDVFPWLHAIANNYDTYHVDKFVVEYVPICPTNTVGQVMMLLDYDALDVTPPANIGEFNNTYGAVSGPVWSSLKLNCEPRYLNTIQTRYTRRGIKVVNDQKSYDFGRLVIAASGTSQVSPGTLHIDYTITLNLPQANLKEAIEAECERVYADDGAVSKTIPFGVDAAITGGAGITVGSTSLTFPKVGEYLVDLVFGGTGLTGADLTQGPADAKAVSAQITKVAAANGLSASYTVLISVLTAGAVWTLTNVPSTTVVATAARIAPYLYSLV